MASASWLRVRFTPSSLYSLRLPYTYQSALTYPVLSPSAIQGLAANALQRVEGTSPSEAAKEVEGSVTAVHATLTGPAVWGTYLVRGLKVEGSKDIGLDALPRSYAHTAAMDLWYFGQTAESGDLFRRMAAALTKVPLTLGDSESVAAPAEVETGAAEIASFEQSEVVELSGFVPARVLRVTEPGVLLYWMAPTLGAADRLVPYYVSIREERREFHPHLVQGGLQEQVLAVVVDGGMFLLAPSGGDLLPKEGKVRGRSSRGGEKERVRLR